MNLTLLSDVNILLSDFFSPSLTFYVVGTDIFFIYEALSYSARSIGDSNRIISVFFSISATYVP